MVRFSFARFASRTAKITGNPRTFALACVLVLIWGATGPHFHFSDTWQLIINTSTTIITCLMVFLLQNDQDRIATATQAKLDEIIRSITSANNNLIAVDVDVEPEQIEAIREELISAKPEA